MRVNVMVMREMYCFGTGARTLLLLAMSLSEITASGSSFPTSVHGPAALRAVAVLMPVSGQDYIESKELVFPPGRVPKPLEPEKPRVISTAPYYVYVLEYVKNMCPPSPPPIVTRLWQWKPFLANFGVLTLLRARSPSTAMLSLLLHSLPVARAVCTHCKDTISPTHLDAACPLVVGIAANAQLFATKSLGASPTLTYSLTHEMAAHFTRPVVDAFKDTKTFKPNGGGDDLSKRPCADFNAGRPCKKLKPDGTCVFAHACNQFVSDKGPNGYCLGDHARGAGCTYDDAKKLRAPAK